MPVDSTIILFVLAGAGVLSFGLYAIKSLLDQVPDVLESWRRTREAWRRATSDAAAQQEGD